MGGIGSSRWETTVTRVTTEGLLRLDVRALARDGCLRPGTTAMVKWTHGPSIVIVMAPGDPHLVTLDYHICTDTEQPMHIRERICLLQTPCTFGGSRVWFSCPGCQHRRAILYAFRGAFRCRTCHRLAYVSTRRKSGESEPHEAI